MFAIRKRALRVHTLDDYVVEGILAPRAHDALRAALVRRDNIVVCGGTGSGKTTLANALLREAVELAGPCERFVILEDTVERLDPQLNSFVTVRAEEALEDARLADGRDSAAPFHGVPIAVKDLKVVRWEA